MAKRVEGKGAIVVGGRTDGRGEVGNGRATARVLAREGARVIVADRRLDSARYGVRANSILPGLMNTPMAWPFRVALWPADAGRGVHLGPDSPDAPAMDDRPGVDEVTPAIEVM
jgi:NAD(P)-dependent dehydrogenase (short-subunit alcohol dehydrogenase family)